MVDLCVIWNMIYVKVWSKHSIFKKGITMLRLLRECIDLWKLCERDDPDSIGILKSYKLKVLDGESRIRFIWISLRFERIDKSKSYGFLEGMIMSWWEHDNIIGTSLRVVISIHEYSRNEWSIYVLVSIDF